MVVGRLGTTSNDGTTIVYDANSEDILEIRIPKVPVGTELYKDENNNWRIHIPTDMARETANRLKQSEEFYYMTRDILSYDDYVYVQDKFPTNCATRFKANPYFLSDISRDDSEKPLCQVPMIDKIITLSTFQDRLREMRYVIKYCLERNENDGHTWIEYGELNKKVRQLLSSCGHPLYTGDISAYLRYFKDDFYFEEDTNDILLSKVALFSTYKRERDIYQLVRYAVSLENPFPLYNPQDNPELAPGQNRAVKYLPIKGGHVSIFTGGPGTGKTTTIATMFNELRMFYPDLNIYLLSPTGKAAKRIKEVFDGQDVNVSTVHKFTGFGHPLTRREIKKIQNADLIIVDESSMLDLDIFERLIMMLNIERTKLILVGDVDQLPSIGAGNILSDLIELGVYTERLTENYRSQGKIISNARLINKGNFFLEEDETFEIISSPTDIANYLAGIDRDADVIITPYKVEHKNGSSEAINKIVQNRKFHTTSYNGFHVGDNIIMVHTNYKQGYFNGETGVILSYRPNGDYVVGFGDRDLIVKDSRDMALGYAITIHKSQGSEYQISGICIPEYNSFITRRMLYTAITRAENKVKLWADKETIRKIIMNNPDQRRRTFLRTFPKL